MTILGIAIAIGVGILLAVLLFLIYRRVDYNFDQFQRGLNKLENMFAAAGSTWMSEFLADLVVGDEVSIMHRLRDLIEAANTVDVFIERIGKPITKFTMEHLNNEERQKILGKFLTNEAAKVQQNTSTAADQ